VRNLRARGPLAYIDNKRAKQLLYALDDYVWGIKITVLEESTDFAILDMEKLFSKLKSHELSRKGRHNHDASFTSEVLITSAVDMMLTPPTSSHLLLSLFYLLLLQLSMSNKRAFLTTRLPCMQ
jgi:hypothetical protein